jgi:hypothetical protein
MRSFTCSLGLLLSLAVPLSAQEKVTFQDHVLPVVEANCAKCHNADKKKGDLDLTSYSAALAGGASGKVIVPGDADGSKIIKVITHQDEPNMPPNRGKMADKEVNVFKKWIAGGLLETLNSKAIAGKPTVDLAIGAGAIGKPDGPPPMPGDLLMEPVVPVKRASSVTGLAASPWAPVVAVAGQKQVSLYNSDTLELLGVLPFKDDQDTYQPDDVKFSRNGKLLVIGGGHAAKAGRVMVFDITSGERIISVGSGQEFDSALGADISPDQTKIVFGGPSRMVKVFSTKDGSVLFKIKKHTDWVMAAAFSPNGEWLATADRNGGISIWDADNGLEIHTLAGHKSAVTALSWRPDSKLLASVSEDGSLKIWEMNEGKQAKTWNPHPAGVLSVAYTHDGRLVTCGRDNQVVAWGADGNKLKSFDFTNELPVRVVFSHDGERVIAADWAGKVAVWNAKTGKVVGEIAANPPTVVEQITAVQKELEQWQSGGVKPSPAKVAAENAAVEALKELAKASNAVEKARATATAKEAEDAKLKAALIAKRTPELEIKRAASKAARDEARLALTNALTSFTASKAAASKVKGGMPEEKPKDPAEQIAILKARLAKLKAAEVYASVYSTRESIAAKKREQEKLLASGTKADKSAAEKLGKQVAQEEKNLQKLTGDYQKLKTAAAESTPKQQARL